MTQLQSPPEIIIEGGAHASPERRLLLAIIINGIHDALGRSAANDHPNERETAKKRARNWFERGGKDFQLVCLSADLDPKTVQAAALEYIAAETEKARSYPKPKGSGALPRYGVSMAKIGERAGVSQEVASRVIKGVSTSHSVRERVLAAYRELIAESGLPNLLEDPEARQAA